MPELINQCVVLPSGNRAVYAISQRALTLQASYGVGPDDAARRYGRLLAHEHSGRWYKPYGWGEITDPKTIELFDSGFDHA